ncbi:MAG: class A beta-lactamase [Myxococcota bacterium]
MTITRRDWLRGTVCGLVACAGRAPIDATEAPASGAASISDQLAALEASVGGTLGVAVLTGSGLVGHRLDERFAMCSTFKMPLVAVILQEVDAGRLSLDQHLPIVAEDLVYHAPITAPLVGVGATLDQLLAAAQMQSDNVAGNLLLRLIGGPEGFTARLRALGDPATRLDRLEPELNVVEPGDERDTTTPTAMARLAATILLGDALSPSSRERLLGWMVATETGAKRLRAGFPPDWRAGDKTGTAFSEGLGNRYNDVAIGFPPQGAPRIVAAYYQTAGYHPEVRDQDQAVLAEVGRIVTAA